MGRPCADTSRVVEWLNAGVAVKDIAGKLGLSTTGLYRAMKRDGIAPPEKPRKLKPAPAVVTAEVVPFTAPPRPSMYALAEHDPVIMRALKERLACMKNS